jgi:outer membrane receptor protein involved in Fe transport
MTDIIVRPRDRRPDRRIAAFRRSLLIAAMTGLAVPTLAYGQAAAEPAQDTASADTAGQSQDIVVTALKRGTRIQETPISISAVTADTIANSGVQNIADLRSQVPSLNFVDGGPSNRRVVIRGIYASGEPTVGVYYDETPVTGVVGASSDAGGSTPELRLFDVQRIEVLRGPQGTLYGSGSMGGTLRVIYNKPTDKWEGAFDGSLSGTEHGGANMEMNGALNVPIVSDKIDARVVGYYKRNAGYIDNIFLGVKGINQEESYGGRAMLRIRPTEDFTLDAAAYFSRSSDDTPSWISDVGKYETDARTRQVVRDNVNLYSLTGTYDMGSVTATGVVSYMDRSLVSQSDTSRYIQGSRNPASCAKLYNANVTCTPAQLSAYYAYVDPQTTSSLYPQQEMHALTAELRLSSSGHGPINWTVGGFYSQRKTDVANPQLNADPLSGYVIPDQVDTVRFINDELKQLAGFADLSWDITSKLNVTGGVRYFKYNKDVSGQTTVPSILVGARITPLTKVSSSEDGKVFKANASYKFTRDIMVYFNAAQGFRPGGVNQVLGLASTLTPYNSDKLWNYEAGIKTSWFGHKLELNGDVFQIDWSNIQVTGRTPNGAFSFITNAGAARVRGVELETSIRPVTGLTIQGNMAYMDAVLTENQANSQVQAPGLKGDRIPYVPKWNAGGSVQYTWPLFGEVNGMVRADFSHVGDSYSDFRPNAIYTRHIDAYNLVNSRIGVEGESGWGAYIFATNLFDALAITRASSSAIGVGLTSVTSAPPRTIGLNVRKSF